MMKTTTKKPFKNTGNHFDDFCLDFLSVLHEAVVEWWPEPPFLGLDEFFEFLEEEAW